MRLTVLLVLIVFQFGFSQERSKQYWQRYDRARIQLASDQPIRAIPTFQALYAEDSADANVALLLGISYIEANIETEKASLLLEQAKEEIGHLMENSGIGPPEYVYYYLIIAYTRAERCLKALKAFDTFVDLADHVDDKQYLKEARKWSMMCGDPTTEAIPIKKRLKKVDRKVVTEPHDYSTASTLYGVQVGALVDPQLTRKFEGLKNVEVYTDMTGTFRYVIGNFIYRSQALRMLEKVKGAGYPDAFIVDITDPDRFPLEVLSVDGIGVNETISGKVDYRIQLAAFAEPFEDKLANYYLMIDSISEVSLNELTLLTVGSFKSYGKALELRNEIRQKGFNEAFIVAFNRGRKIPVDDARKFLRDYTEE